MIAKTRGNTAEFVHQRLLDDLQRGHFLPGDKLTTESLARRYEVSRTPVREALIRLERENVVESTANSGYEIRTPTLDELCEMYEIREALEGLAAAKLTENGASPELVAELRRCCERRRCAELDEKEACDRQFHELICDSCGSKTLQVLVHNYLVLSSVFNVTRSLLKNRPYFNQHDVDLEHERIVEAIEAGDAKRARKLLSEHIAYARKQLQRLLGK